MANVNDAVSNLYGSEQSDAQSKNRRMTEHSRKWSSSGLGLDAAEAEARRLEKKGTFSATMDDEAGTVTLTKDDFKAVMGKLGGHKQTAKRSQTNLILLAFGYLAVSVGFIAVIVGLMNWRLEATKESHVQGSEMLGRDGNAVKTAELINYAQLYDLPKLDVQSLVETKKVQLQFQNGKNMAFEVTGATKMPGSKQVQLLTPGGVIRINGESNLASATVNGQCFKVAMPSKSQTRRLRESTGAILHSHTDFFASGAEGRSLAASSAGGFAGIAIAIGKEVKDLIDNKDPVSGQLTWPSGLTVTFELNGKKVPQSGFDENCQLRNFELHRGDGQFAMHISNPGNSSKDIFITNRVLAEGHVLGNGTFVATMCDRRTRDNLFTMSSDSTVSDDASLKSFFDFDTDSRNTFATETPTLIKNPLYDSIAISEHEIDVACHKLPTSSRRLAMEDSHGHFMKYYHEPMTEMHKSTPRHLWTDETHHQADALAAIKQLYEADKTEALKRGEAEARRLAETASSQAMDDVYDSSRSEVICHTASAWVHSSIKGEGCYLQRQDPRTNTFCLFAFRGSDDGADWADNILGSIQFRTHAGYRLHMGFRNQVLNLDAASLGRKVAACRDPTWVGHSLGGAMAYAARVIYNKGKVNNYAAPAAYLNIFNWWSDNSIGVGRVWHESDAVPYATNIVGYDHVFGSTKLVEACTSWNRCCGFNTWWGCAWHYNCNCRSYRTEQRGSDFHKPTAGVLSLFQDIYNNYIDYRNNGGGIGYHDQTRYYRGQGV